MIALFYPLAGLGIVLAAAMAFEIAVALWDWLQGR